MKIKHLLNKHEDLSSDSQHPHKKLSKGVYACDLSTRKRRQTDVLGTHWPASLVKTGSSGFREREPVSKGEMENDLRKTLSRMDLSPTGVHEQVHTHILTHTTPSPQKKEKWYF